MQSILFLSEAESHLSPNTQTEYLRREAKLGQYKNNGCLASLIEALQYLHVGETLRTIFRKKTHNSEALKLSLKLV